MKNPLRHKSKLELLELLADQERQIIELQTQNAELQKKLSSQPFHAGVVQLTCTGCTAHQRCAQSDRTETGQFSKTQTTEILETLIKLLKNR